MSTDCRPPAASPPAAAKAPPPHKTRRTDPIDEPARPLGTKRAALRLRRHSTAAAAHASGQRTAPGMLTVVSKDATVTFALRATAYGLLVQRTQCQLDGCRLVQAMMFADQPRFDRWCDREPMRFEDPMVYDRLRREGHDALSGQR